MCDTNIKFRSYDEIVNQIDEYKNLEFVTIAGTISEPTLYPDLFDIIRYLIKRGVEISLFINGDTHTDTYYKKLGVIFRQARGSIYFTICGSTQELHERYRVNSNLKKVLNRLDIIEKYSKKGILTWLIFNYNENDFNKNYKTFQQKYNTEFFHTLPVQEHFNIDINIHLIDNLHKIYNNNMDTKDFDNIQCPAINYKFELVDFNGKSSPCILFQLYGDKHCYECSQKNAKMLRDNKIYHIAEPEDSFSEVNLRINYEFRKT